MLVYPPKYKPEPEPCLRRKNIGLFEINLPD